MNINLYVVNNCPACVRAQSKISLFVNERQNLKLIITNVEKSDQKSIPILPALYVNETLFSYGDFDDRKLDLFIGSMD